MPRIAVTGATGLIGRALTSALRADGVQVATVGRGATSDVQWDFRSELSGAALHGFAGVDAVVHLAGAPLDRRWTSEQKRRIFASRVDGTSLLSRALAAREHRPRVLVCASAVGIYGERGDETLTEDSTTGDGFLADVCRAWESATQAAEDAGVRVVHLRSGMVLDAHDGALAKLLLPFKLGLGAKMGDGTQWMSWILMADLVRAIRFAIDRDVPGAVNAVAPSPVTNATFTRALGRVLHRPAVLTVPRFALELAFGEMARATILQSQRAVPARLLAAGFAFEEPEIDGALTRAVSQPSGRRTPRPG